MTKLLEWLLVATAIFGVWFAILIGNSTLGGEWQKLILLLPIIFIFSFGSYAATIVLYRVFTFNTCKNAAVELQQVNLLLIPKFFCFNNNAILTIFILANSRSQKRSAE